MQRTLIILGIVILVIGLAWPLIRKLGLGKLPGDIYINNGNFGFYFPIVTCVLLSIVLSIVLWFLNR